MSASATSGSSEEVEKDVSNSAASSNGEENFSLNLRSCFSLSISFCSAFAPVRSSPPGPMSAPTSKYPIRGEILKYLQTHPAMKPESKMTETFRMKTSSNVIPFKSASFANAFLNLRLIGSQGQIHLWLFRVFSASVLYLIDYLTSKSNAVESDLKSEKNNAAKRRNWRRFQSFTLFAAICAKDSHERLFKLFGHNKKPTVYAIEEHTIPDLALGLTLARCVLKANKERSFSKKSRLNTTFCC